MIRRALLIVAVLFLATNVLAGTGRVVIVNVDPAGSGLNDPTPVAPVGGNPGTTLGQQRTNVFLRAAERWSYSLDTNVDVRVRASFAPLLCSDTRVVLGQASAMQWKADFTGAPKAKVLYPIALANKFANQDLSPTSDDINTQFNSALDTPTCGSGRGWYYGFDGNEGTDNWLYAVVLHEIGHGLGFANFTSPEFFLNMPSVYDTHMFDVTAGLRWDQMTLEQRRISQTNNGNLVWDGPNVTERAPTFLDFATTLTINSRDYNYGTAGFGTPPNRALLAGQVVAAVDEANEAGPATTDGCTAYSNADAINGRIALVDRGTCTFVQKALTAQAAGAIGVILVDNREASCGQPPGMGGSDPEVRIPMVSLTQADGNALRAELPNTTVNATLRIDPTRRDGMTGNFVRLYAPCELSPGSSLAHFDTAASPNLLMEPAISADLLDTLDLSIYQLMDIGWSQLPRTGRRILRK